MRDIAKTLSYGTLHMISGFTIAYLLTGSVAVAGGIALLEPVANTVVFYLHEKVWKRIPDGGASAQPRGAAARRSRSLMARPRPSSGMGMTAMPVNGALSRA